MSIFTNAYNQIASGWDSCKQRAGHCLIKLNKLKKEPDITLKSCQVAFSTIVLANAYHGKEYLSKFGATMLSTASMHNFLGFLKLPYNLTYTVNHNSINGPELIQRLIIQLHNLTDEPRPIIEKDVNLIVSNMLKNMLEQGIAFKTEAEFKAELIKNLGTKYADVNLDKLEIPFLSSTLLEVITTIAFSIVDLLCIPLYLNEWNMSLSGFAKEASHYFGYGSYATSLGQTKAFQFIGELDPNAWAWRFCCVGYGVQLLEAVRKLRDEKLSPALKRRMEWTAISSAAEGILSVGGVYNISKTWMAALTIIAKSIGILALASKLQAKDDTIKDYETKIKKLKE